MRILRERRESLMDMMLTVLLFLLGLLLIVKGGDW